MSDQIRPPAYSPISKWIHWITALCVLGIIPGGIIMTNMNEGPLQSQLYDMHRSFGVVVFVLALARVTARKMFGTPAPLETLTPLERRASVAVHHSLLALIFVMPLLGWLMTSAYRVDVSVFGLFTLPHLMPKSEPIFDALAAALDRHGLGSARAVMLDFFPRSLADLAGADPAAAPFELCSYLDPLVSLDWRDREPRPRAVPLEGVRPRMLGELLKRVPTPPAWLASYKHALVHKAPLLHWQPGVRMRCPHEATLPPSDRVQLVLAHFKFYPGYDERIRAAVASGSYFDASIEYRFLAEACAALEACDLRGPASLRYDGPASLVASGMLFSRLPPAEADR